MEMSYQNHLLVTKTLLCSETGIVEFVPSLLHM